MADLTTAAPPNAASPGLGSCYTGLALSLDLAHTCSSCRALARLRPAAQPSQTLCTQSSRFTALIVLTTAAPPNAASPGLGSCYTGLALSLGMAHGL
ncbi:hypothetical protein C9I49_25945 [Pseudomonas prosekii]|uniref:Uncharacterized protein n=1 Tax=Pseudomonas prosekii TaxID=1148509 RepID=A0A2U2D174_9PSED|nr:hypothetical protein C9I49_25945 [Pseudomonas prosekii]